eukprot:8629135-Alexandrium_andersonii.AAC.1
MAVDGHALPRRRGHPGPDRPHLRPLARRGMGGALRAQPAAPRPCQGARHPSDYLQARRLPRALRLVQEPLRALLPAGAGHGAGGRRQVPLGPTGRHLPRQEPPQAASGERRHEPAHGARGPRGGPALPAEAGGPPTLPN